MNSITREPMKNDPSETALAARRATSIDDLPDIGHEIDRALAYVLGDATDADRYGLEEELLSGDAEITQTLDDALATVSELPAILAPAPPPLFAKERVMSRVRRGYVSSYIPSEKDRAS